MRTKVEAAKTLLESGWTPTDVKFILGNVLELNGPNESAPETPWWTWVGEDWYTSGAPIATDWEAWVAEGKP